MSDTYDGELEKVLVNYGNLNYRLKQGTGEQTQHELMLQAKAKLSALLCRVEIEGRKDQSKITSGWINEHIGLLQKDEKFRNTTGDVALSYARDQARQGRLQALLPRSPQEGEK